MVEKREHILVPLDGSSLAEAVLPHVVALSTALDAQITLLHVLTRPSCQATIKQGHRRQLEMPMARVKREHRNSILQKARR